MHISKIVSGVVFNIAKSSRNESGLNVSAIYLSIMTTKVFARKSFSILFLSSVLTIFIAENTSSLVAIENGKVKTIRIKLSRR